MGMRTKRRSKQRTAAAALCAVLVLGAMAMLALTGSTVRQTRATADTGAVAPENEAAEHASGMTPDEFTDLKESSNDVVTEAMVKRQQAQAAAVEPAAAPNGLSWKQMGPYNV